MSIIDFLPSTSADGDDVYEAFHSWADQEGIDLYDHQEEALMGLCEGNNVIVSTPTGSGKSLIATAAHFYAISRGGTTFYTAPIKALVSEKFFELCNQFGTDNVGMLTGDAAVNPDAPLICCTAEILANLALREGADLDCDQVVADEFHFYSEVDRGWAWQVPLLLLPKTQFVLLSATLGDTSFFEKDLTDRTGRDTLAVTSVQRPVPLHYQWRATPLHDTVEDLLNHQQAPVYLVHFTQASALDSASALISVNPSSKEEKRAIADEIAGFRFTTKFGQTLSRLIRGGVGVHHAGMLPKYRRLVERLAQKGLLKIICGTDTLGVGINVPIRTVVFTGLTKYDGQRTRRLRAREFHQIAGRAGRAGFDTDGYVICQAPEHVIENEKALRKAASNPKKMKKLHKKKPPEGTITWTEEGFNKLIDSPPEPLTSRMRLTNSMLLATLCRPGDSFTNVRNLIEGSHANRSQQIHMARTAISLFRTLRDANIVTVLDQPDNQGRTIALTVDLPDHFALNQPLAPFALAALDLLDDQADTYQMDILSIFEATLDSPGNILAAQRKKAKTEAMDAMRAEGLDYTERMNRLDDIDYPQPLADELDIAFTAYKTSHPWAGDYQLAPKSILRELWEGAMTFSEYIARYQLPRAEGTLLRYLTDAYKTLTQTLPETHKGDQLTDLLSWLGETVRQIDSSLLDEWEQLANPTDTETDTLDIGRPGTAFSDNRHAFTVAIRNSAFRHIELAAHDNISALAALETGWGSSEWDEALEAYFAQHDDIGTTTAARAKNMIDIHEEGRIWKIRHIIDDPQGHHDWHLDAEVDLDASDEAGAVAFTVTGFSND
ncbi:DEAD/DEAH box helicase [Natronoglycomyces albus]|uniref:DEAD/DEAH box helicase n=1 Tax=Natronoglycomyces albus TaxID=2811108 RepID=UPI001FE8787E|nr:DEAD/DEAH box helicase [Natronoglycomyces albus]